MKTSSDPVIRPHPSGPGVYIVIRRTLEWQDEAAVRDGLRPEFRSKYETWNRTFQMPYHLFRVRLRDIARSNLGRVTDSAVVPIAAVPPGALVAPVDDDDWFAPDLANHLRRAHDPAIRGYHWTPYILEAQRVRRRWPWPFRRRGGSAPGAAPIAFTCESNNYAVVNTVGWCELTQRHSLASRHYDEHPSDVKHIALMLSLQNKNLSSQSVLDWGQPTVDPDMLRRRFHRFRSFYSRTVLPAPLSWATPYVHRMAELMHDLRLA